MAETIFTPEATTLAPAGTEILMEIQPVNVQVFTAEE